MTVFEINQDIKRKIVLALDVDSIEKAKELIEELKDYVGIFKVGLQFYTANGDELFNLMNDLGLEYFLDVKFLDIPNTVAKASENVIRKGANFFNLHALGGIEMMKQAIDAAKKTALELNRPDPTVLAVTLLTSIDDEKLNHELEIPSKANEYAITLAKLAKKAHLTGVVASVFEAKRIKEACGKDFKVLCPGIRPSWSAKDDQKRLATPKFAIEQGADYLVIGRAVTNAENRIEAMKKIYQEIEETLGTTKTVKTNAARILLSNGMIFEGESFGAKGTTFGEIVFNTSMAGYQEILTDPSYCEQVIVMTYPEIGNYGINTTDFESDKVHAKGFIVKNSCENESHYLASQTLDNFLKENNVIGVKNVDTRALTKIIRENGVMNCILTTDTVTDELKQQLAQHETPKNLYKLASRNTTKTIQNKGVKIAVIDLGLKNNISNNLTKHGCSLTILPPDTSSEYVLSGDFDAVLLSNGPGDPKEAKDVIDFVKDLIGKLPIFGICLGHQILSLALGARTFKLKYGHRGGNHPVINLKTGKVLLTSQNHGYCIDEITLPEHTEITYRNLNDGTIEGFNCKSLKIAAVQFHPESSPGPDDANGIFKEWIEEISYAKK